MTDDLDFSQFPQTLDLLSVHIPAQQQYVVRNRRLFLTSVEFWNLRTTFQLTWPVVGTEMFSGWRGLEPDAPLCLGSDGRDYGMSGFSTGGDGLLADGTFNTRDPMPLLDWVDLRLFDAIVRLRLQ